MKLVGLLVFFAALVIATTPVHAATSPSLGQAATFGILSSTYTNTAAGTTINSDLGYTTGPAVTPTVNGSTYTPPSPTYTSAGTGQAAALGALNAQPCDFNFGSATDLSLLPQPLAPGVYCITGAASVGTGGVTLAGGGTYIFRINGALNTVANSSVTTANAETACNVFWTPTGATTLGANSTFVGTAIDAAGITVGSTVNWTGRALAFGGTVSTDTDTITSLKCEGNSQPPPDSSFKFPICERVLPRVGDIAHYTTGYHQIVGGPLLFGSDDVYSLERNNFLQCFCPLVGSQGIQTNWLRTDTPIPGWFFENGTAWNLGNFNYAAQNRNFTCQPTPSPNPEKRR